MYFVLTDRNGLIRFVPKQAVWAEVGVYKGDFSQIILETCAPAAYYLIDNRAFDIKTHNPFGENTENFSNFQGRIHWQHFGDNAPDYQNQNYRDVVARFAAHPQVKVIRNESTNGIDMLPDAGLDVIYIDANHQYEYVLRDMIHARKKLKPGGLMLMDDCYEGPGGYEQNNGVMAAVGTYVKRYDYSFVAMTCGTFSNAALTDDPSSLFLRTFLENLRDSQYQFIGISDALVPNLRYKLYKKSNGELRYVPML